MDAFLKQSEHLALVFPGQGSQSVGMLSELAAKYPLVVDTFAEASRVLDYDLWRVASEGPANKLDNTITTQPVLLTAGYACWRILQAESKRTGAEFRPVCLAGHSLGEYTALTAAASLDLTAAVRLVDERGRLMQSAVPAGTGKMAAIIGLDDMAVEKACDKAQTSGTVSAANFNSPGQVVIAGTAAAVDTAIELCKQAGARRVMLLPVSVPSHCALMRTAAEKLGNSLRKMALPDPLIPVVHNVDAQTHHAGADIADLLMAQLYRPVRWTQSVKSMLDQGVTVFAECGPGNVLGGLIKRIAKAHCPDTAITVLRLDDPEQMRALLKLSSIA